MALSIKQIRSLDVRTTFILIVGEKLNFEYTAAAFTPELEEITLNADGELKINTPNILAMLAALILNWDLTVDPPESVTDKKTKKQRPYDATIDDPLGPLPIEIGLRILPKSYLMAMLNRIVEDLNPNPLTEENSDAISDTEAE
jgi:hypothetical protein